VKALKKDPAHDQEEALKDIYRSCALAIRRPWPTPVPFLSGSFSTQRNMISDASDATSSTKSSALMSISANAF
jgi:hypothetical protein